jgi:hypothetical protein
LSFAAFGGTPGRATQAQAFLSRDISRILRALMRSCLRNVILCLRSCNRSWQLGPFFVVSCAGFLEKTRTMSSLSTARCFCTFISILLLFHSFHNSVAVLGLEPSQASNVLPKWGPLTTTRRSFWNLEAKGAMHDDITGTCRTHNLITSSAGPAPGR